ncbi:pyridoxal phosphate-dependent aminotransferase [Sporomusa acidovorans]|uniref:Aminotransferase n=1 Tax=Sporomusa acidovorans (strain ATCC 49682 / DSM 3132 / Mol) TaxID=1123286 RepID=A0ABZ3J9F6_SPOA4|nr:aminotransferase class I/II-fold pyridoxal phosphate-dependent enzyme [Sporomusa acidovorans]OZC16165.1 arginine--pyruvate transaminase AruH [Sporomusa acidovorans DSM 3132]SDE29674.1 Aspartate/methionine/tyrosine aminotransferase [Sporomusa acidovorans]
MKGYSKLTEGLLGQPMLEILTTVCALEAAGKKVYRFEVGDSAIDAYPHIVDAVKKALDEGHTKYVDSLGILPLREAICDYTKRKLGFRPDVSQVAIMPANSVIDFVMRSVVNPGEEVVFSDPGFAVYIAVASYLGMKAVKVPVLEKNDFRLNPEDLLARITDKTRLAIITSPQNPTGGVMTEAEMLRVAEIAKEKDIYLLSDEIYAENIYDCQHYSPAVVDQCRERTIILSGFSKGHSMSGFRLGYAIGPSDLIAKMGQMFETVYTCVPPFIQYAGIAALNTPKELMAERVSRYKKLRDLMVKRLNEIPGITCATPKGAIYVFPNITGTGLSSREFAKVVLEKAGVAVVPGCCFGEGGEGYVRLCYVRDEETIEEACAAIKKALTK